MGIPVHVPVHPSVDRYVLERPKAGLLACGSSSGAFPPAFRRQWQSCRCFIRLQRRGPRGIFTRSSLFSRQACRAPFGLSVFHLRLSFSKKLEQISGCFYLTPSPMACQRNPRHAIRKKHRDTIPKTAGKPLGGGTGKGSRKTKMSASPIKTARRKPAKPGFFLQNAGQTGLSP